MTEAYIIDTVRTPRARRKGKFSGIHAVDLLTLPLIELVKRNGLDPANIEDVAIGCVTQVQEQAWCIARSAILASGWPVSIPGVTINRLCGSGQQACNFLAENLKTTNYNLAIAGGVEHMTRVPMFSDCGGEASPALKAHHPNLTDQGLSAEKLADFFKINREDINAFALHSQQRAAIAKNENRFKKSILPVNYLDSDGNVQTLSQDDNPRPETTLETLHNLKPAFLADGKLTAGNSSAIVDGAGTLLLANDSSIKKYHLKPRARIVASAVVGSDPIIMLSGPIPASQAVLKKANLKISDIDLWEVNEAFAPVVIATYRELGINPELVNVNGGAIALGHPLGATGAMLIGTALDELERQSKKYALVTMCIGLGMGIATIIERV